MESLQPGFVVHKQTDHSSVVRRKKCSAQHRLNLEPVENIETGHNHHTPESAEIFTPICTLIIITNKTALFIPSIANAI